MQRLSLRGLEPERIVSRRTTPIVPGFVTRTSSLAPGRSFLTSHQRQEVESGRVPRDPACLGLERAPLPTAAQANRRAGAGGANGQRGEQGVLPASPGGVEDRRAAGAGSGSPLPGRPARQPAAARPQQGRGRGRRSRWRGRGRRRRDHRRVDLQRPRRRQAHDPEVVRHAQSHGQRRGSGVRARGRRRRSRIGLERAVAVEVPFVSGDRAVRVGGLRGVEADGLPGHGRARRDGERGRRPQRHLHLARRLMDERLVVGHAQADGPRAGRRVGRRGVRLGAGVGFVDAVAVDVPFVPDDGAVGIARSRRAEGDLRADDDDAGCRGERRRRRDARDRRGVVDVDDAGHALSARPTVLVAVVAVDAPDEEGPRRHPRRERRHGRRGVLLVLEVHVVMIGAARKAPGHGLPRQHGDTWSRVVVVRHAHGLVGGDRRRRARRAGRGGDHGRQEAGPGSAARGRAPIAGGPPAAR